MSISILYLLILQCGDVELQPGPIKYPCGICNKNVRWNAKAIQCDGCDIWFHSKCANIGPDSFSRLSKSNVSWICIQCGIANVSSHHSVDLQEYSSHNVYSVLSDLNISHLSLNLSTVNTSSEDFNNIPSSSTPCKPNHPKPSADFPTLLSAHSNSVASDPESSLEVVNNTHCTSTYSSMNNHQDSRDDFKTTNFKCLVMNFQSIRNKKTDLYNLISSMDPDVIIGNETHLDPSFLNAVILPYDIPTEHKYQTFRKDRKVLVDKAGGGVIVMVKPEHNCEECPDLDPTCELTWVKITTDKKNEILIGSYYREPKSSMEALEQLDLSISRIFTYLQKIPSLQNSYRRRL